MTDYEPPRLNSVPRRPRLERLVEVATGVIIFGVTVLFVLGVIKVASLVF